MDQKYWWYNLQFLRHEMWQTEIGNSGPLFTLLPPKNMKNQNFEKIKNCWRYHHFTHVYQKPQIIWGTAPEIWSETKNFLLFWDIVSPLPTPTTQKILKKIKKHLEVPSLTLVYQKSWSYHQALSSCWWPLLGTRKGTKKIKIFFPR